jgi:hypothetical protein
VELACDFVGEQLHPGHVERSRNQRWKFVTIEDRIDFGVGGSAGYPETCEARSTGGRVTGRDPGSVGRSVCCRKHPGATVIVHHEQGVVHTEV